MTKGIKIEASDWKSPSLYIGDLSKTVTEEDLKDVFKSFGNISSVKVCRNWKTGAPLGYGFVNFQSSEDATRALQALNYTNIKGKQCRLMWSTKRSKATLKEDKAANVYVKGIPKNFSNKQLYDMFKPYGTVLSAKVATNSSNVTLGYGYVSFAEFSTAALAIEKVNGSYYNGSIISVEPFVEKFKRAGAIGQSNSTQTQAQDSVYSADEYPSPLPYFSQPYCQYRPSYSVYDSCQTNFVGNSMPEYAEVNFFDSKETLKVEKRRVSATSSSTGMSEINYRNNVFSQDLLGWKQFDEHEDTLDFAPLGKQEIKKLSPSDIDEVIEELSDKLLVNNVENTMNLFD